MNYMKELNAFRDWLSLNQLPTSAIALWHTLMSINNLARWKRTFNAPNSFVKQQTGLSKQGIHNARQILLDHGLIDFKKGAKDRAPVYQMHSRLEPLGQINEQTVDQSKEENLTIRIHKQNETKRKQNVHPFLKNKNKPLASPEKNSTTLFEELRAEAGL